jgi:hypothetical protein
VTDGGIHCWLLLNIWGGKRSGLGLSADSGQEMTEVHRCMRVLRGCEIRCVPLDASGGNKSLTLRSWLSAGKLWDILFNLASAGEVPLPATGNTANKRECGAEEPKFATAPHAVNINPTKRDDTRIPQRMHARQRRRTICLLIAVPMTMPVRLHTCGKVLRR